MHTDLKPYNKWMSSEDEHIIGPVVEYTVETGETFEKPVLITIPHCLPATQLGTIRVLYGQNDAFAVRYSVSVFRRNIGCTSKTYYLHVIM